MSEVGVGEAKNPLQQLVLLARCLPPSVPVASRKEREAFPPSFPSSGKNTSTGDSLQPERQRRGRYAVEAYVHEYWAAQ